MDKFIKVYKNILNPKLIDKIEKLLLSPEFPYYYLQNIADSREIDTYKPGFTNFFQSTLLPEVESKYKFFLLQVLYNFCQKEQISIINILHSRTFLHLPSEKSTPDKQHTDLEFPHWVCLYYVTDSDGDTILFDDNGKEIKRVTPEKGKIVFFDGSIRHCSSSPSKTHRAVININFIGEYLDKQE